MSDFRARSNAELLDAAFEIYRRYFPAFFTVGVLWALPSIVAVYFQRSAAPAGAVPADPTAVLAAGQIVTLVGVLVRSLITPFAEGVMTTLASDAYRGVPTDLASAARAAFAHPVRLFVAWWIRALFEGFGMLLFFIPGLVIFKRYFAIVPAIVIEHLGVGDSIRRSRTLSNGSGSRIFILIGGVWLFTFLVSLMIGGFLAAISQSTLVAMLGVTVLGALFPFAIVAATLLYYDIRIRKEGYDIELLAAGLDASPHAQPLPAS